MRSILADGSLLRVLAHVARVLPRERAAGVAALAAEQAPAWAREVVRQAVGYV